MRVKGVLITGSPTKVFILRPDDANKIVFYGKAMQDWEEFEKLFPEPTPPKMTVAGNGVIEDKNHPNYLSLLAAYAAARSAWIVIKTLEPSEIEWALVKKEEPSTWSLWQKDFLNGGLTAIELQKLFDWIIEVNNLDEDKLKKARDAFQLEMDRS